MNKGKKYTLTIEQSNDTWIAQIIRQVTSKKTIVTKQQDGFKSEQEAQQWGATALSELTDVLSASNLRHGQQRKTIEETKHQRSARRAKKTEQAKLQKATEETNALKQLDDPTTD